MQPITKHSLFSLGQVVATPGALTALPLSKRRDNSRRSSSPDTFRAIGATCAKKTAKKTRLASNVASGFSAATTRPLARHCTSSPKQTDL